MVDRGASKLVISLVLTALGCGRTDQEGGGGAPGFPHLAGASGSRAASAGIGGGDAASAGAGAGGSSGANGDADGGMAGDPGAPGGAPASSGSGGGGAGGQVSDIIAVAPSHGCGKAYLGNIGASVNTIQTMGVKDADCADKVGGVPKCGAWSTPRDYYVYLPAAYDENKPYPLVLQGPGCGGNGTNVYPITDSSAANAGNSVLRVGLTPGPNSLGHGTNENQGCFDDKEGDDSIDWAFYEALYDRLDQELCFDRNRVFAAGNSSGAWFANELVCKYADDPARPVRGVMTNGGGLPNEPKFAPTCRKAAMAGLWAFEVGDNSDVFLGYKFAISRAMKANGCTGALDYDAAIFNQETQSFPIGGNNPDNTCRLLTSCPARYPLVVCPLSASQHGSHDEVVNPAFSTFLKQFSAPPLHAP